MGKIRYTVRLYRLHDMDLITFVLTHEFDVMHAIYSALAAFAKGEVFVIEIPPSNGSELPQLRRIYTKALILDEEKDKAAIELVNKIKPGRRNNFFKNLLRIYLLCPYSEDFLEDPADQDWFDEKIQIFRAGRRVVKAGKVKKSIRKGGTQKAELSSAFEEETDVPDKIQAEQKSVEATKPASEPEADNGLPADADDADAIMELFESLGGEG